MILSYIELITQAWRFAWKNKVLWLVGLFVTELSFFLTFNSQNDIFLYIASSNDALQNFFQFFTKFSAAIIFLFSIFLVLIISFLALVFKSGMIAGIKNGLSGQVITFKQSFQMGIRKFLPMLVLEIYFLIPNIVLFFVFLINARTAGNFIVDLVASVVMIIYNVFVMLFNIFSYHYIVNEHESPWSALFKGWQLLRKKFVSVMMVNVIRIVVSLGFVLIDLLAVFIAMIPFVFLAFLMYYIGLVWLAILTVIIGILAILFILFMIKGLKTTYVYTLFSKAFEQLK